VYLAPHGHHIGATLILAHGAGAPQQSTFMVDFARGLSARGINVVTFNFLYTEQKRRVPDRAPVLEACYRAVIDAARRHAPIARAGLPQRLGGVAQAIFIGGKSMGGRIATQIAAADPRLRIAGLVLLGYPLHPPGRPDRPRDRHLAAIRRPMLIVQGSRDAFGLPAELQPVISRLEPQPALEVVPGGDHSFNLTRNDPAGQAAVLANAQGAIAGWIAAVVRQNTPAR
jgi:predicted alpha/beta-hydrolase family hydrolase